MGGNYLSSGESQKTKQIHESLRNQRQQPFQELMVWVRLILKKLIETVRYSGPPSSVHSIQPGNHSSPTSTEDQKFVLQKGYITQSLLPEATLGRVECGRTISKVGRLSKYLHQLYGTLSSIELLGLGHEAGCCVSEQLNVKMLKAVISGFLVKVSISLEHHSVTPKAASPSLNTCNFQLAHVFTFYSKIVVLRSCEIQCREIPCTHLLDSPNAHILNNYSALSKLEN